MNWYAEFSLALVAGVLLWFVYVWVCFWPLAFPSSPRQNGYEGLGPAYRIPLTALILLSILLFVCVWLVGCAWFRLWPPARRQARQERERWQREREREKASRIDFRRDQFFWPHWRSLDEEGVLRMVLTGWDDWKYPDGTEGGERWSGEARFEPSGPDYDFWVWMICAKKIDRVVAERDLPPYRAEFEAAGAPAPPPEWLSHLRKPQAPKRRWRDLFGGLRVRPRG